MTVEELKKEIKDSENMIQLRKLRYSVLRLGKKHACLPDLHKAWRQQKNALELLNVSRPRKEE